MNIDDIGYQVIGAAMEVQNALGPGLLENVYKHVLAHELQQRDLLVEIEVPMNIVYKNQTFDLGYRADLIVEKSIIIELKTVERLLPIHEAQLLTYLKLSNLELGYLINFNSTSIVHNHSLRRIVNNKK